MAVWKSLTASQFRADLLALGFQVEGSGSNPKTWTYRFADLVVPFQDLNRFLGDLAPGVYYYDSAGYHYVQEPGAINPATGQPAKVTTETAKAPVTTAVPLGTAVNAYTQQQVDIPGAWGGEIPGGGGAPGYWPSNISGGTGQGSTAPEYTPGGSNQPGVWYMEGQVVTGPVVGGEPATTADPLTNFGISYGSAAEAAVAANPNITAADLANQFKWTEDAAYSGVIDAEVLAEVYGLSWSSDQWYTLVSGGQGSGVLRAQLQEAQNRIAFREDYRNYFGSDPDPAAYEWLDSNYISPSEFANHMKAVESAKAMFPSVNELLGRTLNHQVTLEELENLAMGGKDSGTLQAMLEEATRLDAYTDTLYQWLGRAPTADDYAREVAGFTSVDTFKWEITVREQMVEMGDEIGDTFQKAFGYRLTDAQLKTLLGQSEGWGELKREYNKALEKTQLMETGRRYAMQAEKISPAYTGSFQGGIKEGLPELPDIGGML